MLADARVVPARALPGPFRPPRAREAGRWAALRNAALMPGNAGIYLHVPFCARACPYCDFDFEVGRTPNLALYVDGLERELSQRAAELLQPFDTLYLGGGTPSLLGAEALAQVIALVRSAAPMLSTVECTLEANPEHVDREHVAAWREVGIDRVSLGVQSFDPRGIEQLGRGHSVMQAMEACRELSRAGLRVSVDLILGWQGQDQASLARELDVIALLGVSHVSVYALTIEEGTPWPKLVRRGLRVLPDNDTQGVLMEQVHSALTELGLQHYEVASYGRPGDRSLHNQKYWQWHDYVGLGPSAASARYRVDGAVTRLSNARGLRSWASGHPGTSEELRAEQAIAEGLWLSLRQLGPILLADLERRFAGVPKARIDDLLHRLERKMLITRDDRSFQLTPGSWRLHDLVGMTVL